MPADVSSSASSSSSGPSPQKASASAGFRDSLDDTDVTAATTAAAPDYAAVAAGESYGSLLSAFVSEVAALRSEAASAQSTLTSARLELDATQVRRTKVKAMLNQ